MPDDALLRLALERLRERGALGELDLPAAIAHSDHFVAALAPTVSRLIDLGSGGGLPGLVIAVRRPNLTVVLTDRRERRADLLRLACSQLGLDDRVTVLTTDVVGLGLDPAFARRFDAVTARAFGEPLWTMECARPFLRDKGVLVVSEPPPADEDRERWPDESVAALGFRSVPWQFPGVRCFERAMMFHVEHSPGGLSPADDVSRET
jgi:16S rRNA G527 N7-methylase RsmG